MSFLEYRCKITAMNIRERRNLFYRLISGVLLILPTIIMVFSAIGIINGQAENKVLPLIAIILTTMFSLAEAILIFMGRKKEIIIKDIAFNENNRVNNLFLVPVIIGTLFSITIISVCTVVFFTKEGEPYFTSSLVIISIGLFLLINCLIYFLYLIMFRKHKLTLEDFAK